MRWKKLTYNFSWHHMGFLPLNITNIFYQWDATSHKWHNWKNPDISGDNNNLILWYLYIILWKHDMSSSHISDVYDPLITLNPLEKYWLNQVPSPYSKIYWNINASWNSEYSPENIFEYEVLIFKSVQFVCWILIILESLEC